MQFKTRYLEIGESVSTSRPSEKKGKASGLRKLIRETQSSDEDDTMNNSAAANSDPSRPWYADFKNYIDTLEAKPLPGMSTIQWWGVSILLHYIYSLSLTFNYRSMHTDMARCGLPSLETTYQ